jgi:hypothetical protein
MNPTKNHGESVAPEGYAVSAPLVTPVVLLFLQTL